MKLNLIYKGPSIIRSVIVFHSRVEIYSCIHILSAPASCMAEKTIVAEDEDIQVILNWPETVVGQMVTANCTCRNITIGSASRVCGGDIEDGGMWEMPDDEACRFTETVRAICQLANVRFVFMAVTS